MTTKQQPDAAQDGADGLELFLLTLRYKEGRLQSLEGNMPLLLNDPAAAWIVYNGRVDVFAVRLHDGEAIAPRRHLMRAETGDILIGLAADASGSDVGLVATGVPDTRVLKLKVSRLRALTDDIEYKAVIGALLDRWIDKLASAIVREIVPKNPTFLEAGQQAELKQDEAAIPKSGVLWVKHLSGNSYFAGRDDLPYLHGERFLPLSSHTWLRATDPSTLFAIDTLALFAQDPEWASLSAFQWLARQAVTVNIEGEEAAEQERLHKKAAARTRVVEGAFAQIGSLLGPTTSTPTAILQAAERDPLLAACQMVGTSLGITIVAPPTMGTSRGQQSAIRQIVRASNVRVRQVTLKGAWWTSDHGPLLASTEVPERPVALLPTSPTSYTVHDPVARTNTIVTPQIAATLAPTAYTFYRPFPQRALNAWDLLFFGSRGTGRDIAMIVLMGVLMGVLGLVGPIATGIIFDRVIPETARGRLLGIGLVLLAIALSSALFQVVRNIAVLRVESKVDGAVQAAVWDRLLSLPVPFFRNYTAGDLGVRAMGINAIRQALSGPVVTTILSGIFSLFSLALLFTYDSGLAMIATGLVLLAVCVTTLAGYLQVRHQRATTEISGRISGMVLEYINGIAKFRVAGAEHRAFAAWADEFTQQRRLTYRARGVGNALAVFNGAYPIITALVLFASVAASLGRGLTSGQFLAFNAAFTQLLFAALQVSGALTTILYIIPLYERAKPILQTLPEVSQAKLDPGELSGEIEIGHVSFRYNEQAPLVLKDISLHIRPGEFVALVGASGSGKSTLLRLMLGFDAPETGALYYDGQDLAGLDLGAVRQQTGVVLQNGTLMAGTLLQNIIGSSLLTVDDAWDAARMAGFDDDIKQMPMGMFTVLSEGAGTLSGGQRQRLLIARAIAHKPRIIFFDEATSALDNRTQEVVSRSLEGLHATRVVIAHRLSTIINAHRIYVLDEGRIVQTGTYSELVVQPGLFAHLAKRQTT